MLTRRGCKVPWPGPGDRQPGQVDRPHAPGQQRAGAGLVHGAMILNSPGRQLIWSPHSIEIRYIPGIYTFRIYIPGIYQVYSMNMISKQYHVFINSNAYMPLMSIADMQNGSVSGWVRISQKLYGAKDKKLTIN